MASSEKLALRHFKKVDPLLFGRAKKARLEPLSPRKPSEYFTSLCKEIIGQQLSGKVAKAIFKRFKGVFPGNRITVAGAFKLTEKQLRSTGMSWSKAGFIKDLAGKVASKQVNLKGLAKLGDQEVASELSKVKGIGPWTCEMFLMFTLGREDVFSHGDLGLRKAIVSLYSIENPSKEVVEKLSAKWSPYRTYACLALWNAVDAEAWG